MLVLKLRRTVIKHKLKGSVGSESMNYSWLAFSLLPLSAVKHRCHGDHPYKSRAKSASTSFCNLQASSQMHRLTMPLRSDGSLCIMEIPAGPKQKVRKM